MRDFRFNQAIYLLFNKLSFELFKEKAVMLAFAKSVFQLFESGDFSDLEVIIYLSITLLYLLRARSLLGITNEDLNQMNLSVVNSAIRALTKRHCDVQA